MTNVGFRLIRTLYSASRVDPIKSRSPSSSASFSSSGRRRIPEEADPRDLTDLEDQLNVPRRGHRGRGFEKALRLEYEFFKFNGQQVPEVMTDELWAEVKALETAADRMKFYQHVRLKERERHRTKKPIKGESMEQKRWAKLAAAMAAADGEEKEKLPESRYDERGYSLLDPEPYIIRPIYKEAVHRQQNCNLSYGWNFGQPLVLDLGVEYQMSTLEGDDMVKQMNMLYSSNREHWEPFNLYLCNYNPRDPTHRRLAESRATENRLWNVTRKCFSRVFPREKIIYLTHQSRVPLTHYYHDAVYVLGACVATKPGLDEMSRVKKMGVQHAFFDIRPYFTSMRGKDHIPLCHKFNVLLDHRETPNLHFALRHFSGSRRFEYKEPAMNRIKRDDQIWAKKRPIMLPRLPHDIDKYEMDDSLPTGWREWSDADRDGVDGER